MTDKATISTYVISFLTVLSGLNLNQWLTLAGFLLGVAAFAVNWYYKHKNYLLNKQAILNTNKQSEKS